MPAFAKKSREGWVRKSALLSTRNLMAFHHFEHGDSWYNEDNATNNCPKGSLKKSVIETNVARFARTTYP